MLIGIDLTNIGGYLLYVIRRCHLIKICGKVVGQKLFYLSAPIHDLF